MMRQYGLWGVQKDSFSSELHAREVLCLEGLLKASFKGSIWVSEGH